jgi:integrase
MARTIELLTAKEVERLKQPGMHSVDAGLYLQIKNGARSWIHRYTINRKARWSGLGSYPEMSLAGARAKLKDEQAQIRAGIDPVADRKRMRGEKLAEQPKKTFREVAKDYITNHESSWKNPVHRKQWTSTLEAYVYLTIGDMPVDQIITDHVRQVLQPIWYTKPETARRIRGRIEKILGFAKPLGLRTGENPARLTDNIEHVLPKRAKRKVKHHPAMPYGELPAFMVKLRGQENIAARCLEYTTLCATRTGDAIGSKREDRPPMKWPHVDLDAKIWVIPATKNDEEHKVPLSDPAVAVLKSVKALGLDSELVFPSPNGRGQPLSNNAMLALLDRMGHGDVTVHGMRSTFRDWAAECTNFPRELAEKALAHTIGDETERAYQRGDLLSKRRKLMEAWAGYCAKPATPTGKLLLMHR